MMDDASTLAIAVIILGAAGGLLFCLGAMAGHRRAYDGAREAEEETTYACMARLKKQANEIERLSGERDGAIDELCRWRSAFQSCTPGGSEFQSPEAVRAYMQQLRQELSAMKKATFGLAQTSSEQ